MNTESELMKEPWLTFLTLIPKVEGEIEQNIIKFGNITFKYSVIALDELEVGLVSLSIIKLTNLMPDGNSSGLSARSFSLTKESLNSLIDKVKELKAFL